MGDHGQILTLEDIIEYNEELQNLLGQTGIKIGIHSLIITLLILYI